MKKARKKQMAEKAFTPAQRLFQGAKNPKKQRKIVTLEQWVEVLVEDGKVTTTLYPSNEALLEEGIKMFPPPELVYRRINFPDGVPDVYSWCGPTQEIREFGGCGIQRMTLDTWLMVVEQEKGFSDGKVGGTGGWQSAAAGGARRVRVCVMSAEGVRGFRRIAGDRDWSARAKVTKHLRRYRRSVQRMCTRFGLERHTGTIRKLCSKMPAKYADYPDGEFWVIGEPRLSYALGPGRYASQVNMGARQDLRLSRPSTNGHQILDLYRGRDRDPVAWPGTREPLR